MNIYSVNPNGEPSQPFQGNRDIPISRQPLSHESVFSPTQLPDFTSHQHLINYLHSVDKLFIQQSISLLEVVVGIQSQNKYQILNPLGQKVFLALETSDWFAVILCGPMRNFEMHLYDNLNNEVIRMQRSTSCAFWHQKMEVFSPIDALVGYVATESDWFHVVFGIYDKDDVKVLEVNGPICSCKCCKDIDYEVRTTTGESIGTISKQWMGFLQEGFTDADTFRICFPLDLDVKMKMVLLGATFVIDYMFHERRR